MYKNLSERERERGLRKYENLSKNAGKKREGRV